MKHLATLDNLNPGITEHLPEGTKLLMWCGKTIAVYALVGTIPEARFPELCDSLRANPPVDLATLTRNEGHYVEIEINQKEPQ